MKKEDGKRAWHTGMRTNYKRYGPNLTEVIYTGTMDNGKADIQYTTSIGRSDDMTRGLFKIRMDVRNNVTFSDLAIFQLSAEKYHYPIAEKLHLGNEKKHLRTWNTGNKLLKSGFIGEKQPFQGDNPWIMFTGSSLPGDQTEAYRAADRGFILRNWKVRIHGKEEVLPHWQEYYTAEGGHGEPTSIINLTLPENIHTLFAGDYIEAEVEMFVVPIKAADYYGPNKNFHTALKVGKGSWKPALREAKGNNISVIETEGRCLSHYPIVIEATQNRAAFKIKGGIGYVPLTITGLTTYCTPKLSVLDTKGWKEIDQSNYGKDFWQTDYNTNTGHWEITYNINLDTPGDQVTTRSFRFELTK